MDHERSWVSVTRSTAESDPEGLVFRARNGDTRAFERLYRENVDHVHALCLRMTADADRAEELTQEAFVRAWQRLDSFRGDSRFSTWLHRLAANVVKEAWRSSKRRESRNEVAADLMGLHEHHGDGVPEARIALERAVARLPDGARMVFVLYDVEGYKHREIAEMTGTAVGTVKAQLHRARRLLREELRT